MRSVERSGAMPLVLPTLPAETADAVLDRLDGLLLSGGIDVDPALYGRAPHPKLGRVDRERDDFELALTREALRRDLPILAICRGHQVLNVATGGTLIQDIPSELKGAVTHDAPGRRTRRVARGRGGRGVEARARSSGAGTISVNSFHHQAIDELGEGLTRLGALPGGRRDRGRRDERPRLRARRAVAPGVVLERGGSRSRRCSTRTPPRVTPARW